MQIRGAVTLASHNAGKLAELAKLANGAFELRLLPREPAPPVVDEDQDTYVGNALKKARAVADFVGGAALADDSGLEVDALGGAPGVRSARYGGPGLDDAGRCALLLRQLGDEPRRSARFRCALVLVQGDEWIVGEGTLEGEITREPRGAGGFGYDPVFLVPSLGRTLAAIPAEEKNRISHRAAAMRALLARLRGETAG
ncbi:MAG TPA: RdgB/HAM1 family non-canonical purine NTP pyrophosphatase [Candidatus Binatia bacterium]